MVFVSNCWLCYQLQCSVLDDESSAPASALLWLYYFLAQHYDQKREYLKAMEYVDLAIDHTPTLVEAYSYKAKIFKVCF